MLVDSDRRSMLYGIAGLLSATTGAGCTSLLETENEDNHGDPSDDYTTPPGDENGYADGNGLNGDNGNGDKNGIDDDNGDKNDYEPDECKDDEKDENGDPVIEKEYELDLSIEGVDLTGVYDNLLQEYTPEEISGFTEDDWRYAWANVHGNDGLREQDHLRGEYSVIEKTLEDGEIIEETELEPGELDSLTLSLNEEVYDETKNGVGEIEIPATHLPEGQNTVELQIEIDDETLFEQLSTEKILPENHLIEGYRDGEKITEYWSPYKFDTHNLDSQEYEEKRSEAVERTAHSGFDPERHIQQERLKEVLEDEDPEQRTKRRLLTGIGMDVRDYVGAHSGRAQMQAACEEIAFRELDFIPFKEVYANGFHNPNDRTVDETSGNHGSKAIYIEGDWYHHETISHETRHVDNFDDNIILTNGTHEDFVSVMFEFHEGEMEETSFSTKMGRISAFHTGQVMPGGAVTTSDLRTSDSYGSTSLEMIRDNRAREELMTPLEIGADYFLETGDKVMALGTPEEPVLLATDNQSMHDRLESDINFQNVETVLEEALN